LDGKTAVLPGMTKQDYIFDQLGGGKSSQVARFSFTFVTISYLVTTCDDDIYRKRSL